MKIEVKQLVWTMGILMLTLGTLTAQENGELYQWDIVAVHTLLPGDVLLSPGGTAFLTAPDNTSLTLTGTGVFTVDQSPRVEGPRIGQTASGGGTWTLKSPPTINFPFEGSVLANGTYTADELVHFQITSGRAASNLLDSVGAQADLRAGLLILKLKFSDSSRGTLLLETALSGTSAATPKSIRVIKAAVEFSASETATIHRRR